jgi:hypothetical protein
VGHWFNVKLVAGLLIPAVIVVALVYGETRLVDRSPSQSYARAKGVVWAGHTFVNRAQFARWLRAHGVRYRRFARRHPALVAPARPRAANPGAGRVAKARGAERWSDGLSLRTIGVGAVCAFLCLVLALRGRRLVRWAGRGLGGVGRRAIALAVAYRAHRVAGRAPVTPAPRPDPPAERRGAGAVAAPLPHMLLPRPRRAFQRGADLRETAFRLEILARSAVFIVQRRRVELAWCLATALLAVGTGLLVTAWLSGA